MRKSLIVLFCGSVLFVCWSLRDFSVRAQQADDGNSQAFECSLAGTWFATTVFEEEFVLQMIPLDPTGQRFAIHQQYITPDDVTIGGFFEEAVFATDYRGTLVRTSPGIYDITVYRFAVNAAGERVYDLLVSGTVVQTDCDHLSASYAWNFVTPDGVSQLCGPATGQFSRLGLLAPCTDLPPLPE